MTTAELLARHIGHRTTPVSPTALRCVDCGHLLDLRERPSRAGSTSTSPSALPPNSARGEACPVHGGWASNCGGCRADELAARLSAQPTGPRGAPMPDGFRELVRAGQVRNLPAETVEGAA